MKSQHILLSCFTVLAVMLAGIACSQKPVQDAAYDPSLNYAAFLVVNTEYGKDSLERMKAHSLEESFEIGPIEYYQPGTREFKPVLTRLTASKQVKLVWIISSVFDVNDIKKAIAGVDYTGVYRYVPISDQTGPIKLQQ